MNTYDFDLHGFLRLRLQNATEQEAQAVQRQVGPINAPVEGVPDLIVDFLDEQPTAPNLRYIGLHDAAYTNDDFYVLKGRNKSYVKIGVDFEQIGHQLTITSERGVSAVPLLIPLINLTLLTKGILPFHASAFTFKDKGVLVTGWAKGGKTETLLAFMDQGARYVGDEWVYLRGDGEEMFGIPEPIRLWNWQLDSLPQYRDRMNSEDKFRLNSLNALSRSMDWLTHPKSSGSPARLARRIQPMVNRQLFTHIAPHTLFGKDNIQVCSPIDTIFLAISHNSEAVTVEPVDAEEVARRMMFSLAEEQAVLLSYYQKYRYAFPDRCNPWLDNLERLQYKLLHKALKDKPAFAVYHPYPVHIPRLFEALQPYVKL